MSQNTDFIPCLDWNKSRYHFRWTTRLRRWWGFSASVCVCVSSTNQRLQTTPLGVVSFLWIAFHIPMCLCAYCCVGYVASRGKTQKLSTVVVKARMLYEWVGHFKRYHVQESVGFFRIFSYGFFCHKMVKCHASLKKEKGMRWHFDELCRALMLKLFCHLLIFDSLLKLLFKNMFELCFDVCLRWLYFSKVLSWRTTFKY